MARQTRRKRDSKSKNRFRTRLAATSSSDRGISSGKDSKLGLKSTKTSQVNWATVLATNREAKFILNNGAVLIDQRVVRKPKYPFRN